MPQIDDRLEEIRLEMKSLSAVFEEFHENQRYFHDTLLEQILAAHSEDPRIVACVSDVRANIRDDAQRFSNNVEECEAELRRKCNKLEDQKEEELRRQRQKESKEGG